MQHDPLGRLRAICLAWPESTEKLSWGVVPTFRAPDRIFAQYEVNHHGDGRVALWLKAPPGAQAILVGGHPTRFLVPPYVGHHGWVGVRLDIAVVDWDKVAGLVTESCLMTSLTRLAALVERR
jgi:hypothetical protein